MVLILSEITFTNKSLISLQIPKIHPRVASVTQAFATQLGTLACELTLPTDHNDDSNSKPLEVKVKYWGETGIQSPKNEVNNRRKKRQSLEFNLEEAIENESIMQDIFQATDDLNVINIPIKIVEVKNWGETGIQKPSDSI